MILYYKMDGTPYQGTEDEICRLWANDFEKPERILKQETLPNGFRVSTVWLGMDHGFGGDKPLIFETMVFGDGADDDMERYSTKAEALAGHERMVAIWKLK